MSGRRGLIDDLACAELPVWRRAGLFHALKRPWCFPIDAPLAESALRLGLTSPPPPEPGRTVVPTVTEGGQRACLYELGPVRGPQSSSLVPWGAGATRAIELAHAVIARDLGALAPSLSPERLRWGASLLVRVGDGLDRVVDGPSVGLGAALATASLYLSRSVPPTLLATAEVTSQGEVRAVGGLEEKLALVASSGLGITDVLVAAEQVGLAESIAPRLVRPLRLRGARDVRDALDVAFGFASDPRTLLDFFSKAEAAEQAARQLFDWVLSGTPAALDWAVVTPIARAARARLEEENDGTIGALDALSRVAFVESVWRRHAGEPSVLPFPSDVWLAALPRPRRLRILAHVVQSAADADDALAAEFAARAEAFLAPWADATEVDWVLAGALGRALAAIESWEGAARHLDAALEGWLAIAAYHELSLPLCERIRVAALLRDDRTLERLARDVVPLALAHPSAHPVSNAFVRIALARAWLLGGAPEGVLDELVDERLDWATLPLHLQNVRARFRALAYEAAGDEDRAAAVVSALEAQGTRGRADEQVLLCRLTNSGQVAEDALRALQQHPRIGTEILRIVARLGSVSAPARPATVMRRFRY